MSDVLFNAKKLHNCNKRTLVLVAKWLDYSIWAPQTSWGFEPGTRGGYLAWISCKYILKFIPWANTRVASSVYTGTRYSLCHGVDNSKCHLDCQSGWSAWYDFPTAEWMCPGLWSAKHV